MSDLAHCGACGNVHHKAEPPYCTRNRDACPKDAEIARLAGVVNALREGIDHLDNYHGAMTYQELDLHVAKLKELTK